MSQPIKQIETERSQAQAPATKRCSLQLVALPYVPSLTQPHVGPVPARTLTAARTPPRWRTRDGAHAPAGPFLIFAR